MNESVERQLYEIIAKQSGVDASAITPQSTLKDLGVDSLTAIETIFEIEEHFGVTLPDRDPNFDTDSVQGLATALQQALDGAAAAPGAA